MDLSPPQKVSGTPGRVVYANVATIVPAGFLRRKINFLPFHSRKT